MKTRDIFGKEHDVVLYLSTSTWGQSEFGSLRARPAYVTEDGTSARFCNGALSGLELHAQFDKNGARAFKPYGAEAQYGESLYTSLHKARAMVKTLGTIERKLAKYAKDWGPTGDDVGQQVIRFARAVGAKHIIRSMTANRNSGYIIRSKVAEAGYLVGYKLQDAKGGKYDIVR